MFLMLASSAMRVFPDAVGVHTRRFLCFRSPFWMLFCCDGRSVFIVFLSMLYCGCGILFFMFVRFMLWVVYFFF